MDDLEMLHRRACLLQGQVHGLIAMVCAQLAATPTVTLHRVAEEFEQCCLAVEAASLNEDTSDVELIRAGLDPVRTKLAEYLQSTIAARRGAE